MGEESEEGRERGEGEEAQEGRGGKGEWEPGPLVPSAEALLAVVLLPLPEVLGVVEVLVAAVEGSVAAREVSSAPVAVEEVLVVAAEVVAVERVLVVVAAGVPLSPEEGEGVPRGSAPSSSVATLPARSKRGCAHWFLAVESLPSSLARLEPVGPSCRKRRLPSGIVRTPRVVRVSSRAFSTS